MQMSVFSLPVHVIWLGCLLTGMVISRKLEHYLHEEEKAKADQKAKDEAHPHAHHHKHPHRHHHN
jgi:hypothetical protein